jgi:putative ubiquitin-RnfH superfamily antitoxin RatB of RatAB toxin-antitoxin module
LASGATAAEALHASGLLEKHPALDPGEVVLGMFGSRVRPDRRLAEGDRLEILRPLALQPGEARRRRARRRG